MDISIQNQIELRNNKARREKVNSSEREHIEKIQGA